MRKKNPPYIVTFQLDDGTEKVVERPFASLEAASSWAEKEKMISILAAADLQEIEVSAAHITTWDIAPPEGLR